MKNVIDNIINGVDVEPLCLNVVENLFKQGPVSITDLEILCYVSLYQPSIFSIYQNSIINYMALYYKESTRDTLKEVVFGQHRKYLIETFNQSYTPVQANIVKGIDRNKCFSFSAPTSTGKSFVFLNLISQSQKDVVVVVPSRALINEYFLKLNELIQEKSTNVLTFIDKVNTSYAKRNVFVVTPERCRELFKKKDQFDVDLFLFDEAQLTDEDSKRGLYFDSIVRRCHTAFPNSKFVFAHPFIKNPEAQIVKNHFDAQTANAVQYVYKNVGQLFLAVDKTWNFYHFGADPKIMGKRKTKCLFDPIEKSILRGGSVLIYISKAKIYNRGFLNEFSKYIDLCKEVDDPEAEEYISQLKEYTGGDTIANKDHYSQLIALMKRGVVIHHGSLPLKTRIIIEQFTRSGFCRICFATSTLEQGINMPFDVVFLDRLEASKPLATMNLIGRAGRSTSKHQFDFGYVVINSPSNISKFRQILTSDIVLDTVSSLEKTESGDDDYNDFKEAIINGTFSDEYNLTEGELEKVSSTDADVAILSILNILFQDETLISLDRINSLPGARPQLYNDFYALYERFLGRDLNDAERNVLRTAIQIALWRVHAKTFKNMCWYRYSYVSKSTERDSLERSNRRSDILEANFVTGYHDLPNKNLAVYSLFARGTKAKDVDYDLIMYDTYDYIDKLIGFKLSDIFYATFERFFNRTNDQRAWKLARLLNMERITKDSFGCFGMGYHLRTLIC